MLRKRLLDYAAKTGIQIQVDPHLHDWKKWGLPDLRGFTPHLRRVRVTAAGLKSDWLIHDLLHVLFYDYACVLLGQQAFKDHQRFLEVHLASELFAVFVLDYSYLVPKGKGLAIDLDLRHWNRYEAANIELPDIHTAEFCQKLGSLYLEGNSKWLGCKALEKDKAYQTWIGHEIRYTEKQRLYAQMWWFDLQGKPFNKKIPVIQGSVAPGIVWELSDIVLSSGATQWGALIADIKKSRPKGLTNYFSETPKYKSKKRFQPDFRFTSLQSITPQALLKDKTQLRRPSPSSLFLVWQALSLQKPSSFSKAELSQIAELARKSQVQPKVENSLFHQVFDLALRDLPKWKSNSQLASTFFLA